MRKGIIVNVILGFLLFSLTGSVWASDTGTKISLDEGNLFRHRFQIVPNHEYAISVNVRTDLRDVEVVVSVNLCDENDQVVDFLEVYRGLGHEGDWIPIGLEFQTTSEVTSAEIVLAASKEGEYWLRELKIVTIDNSEHTLKEIWEEKFTIYGTVYTGLIIDARGLDIRRGMSPRILSESGQLLYGGVSASMDYIQEVGIVAYGTEITPKLLERIQVDPSYPLAIPLIVRPLGPADPTKSSVVISDEDAQKIIESLVAYDYFASYKVIFIVE